MANPLGIKSIGISLVSSLTVEKKLTESEPLRDSDGTVVEGDARDPIWEISIEGRGDLPDALIAGSVGDLTITGITGGKTIIEKHTDTQTNEKYNEFKASAKNFPMAA